MHPLELESKDGLFPARWFVFVIGVLAAIGLFQAVSMPVNGDAAWYLYVAGRMLNGARLYEDLFDTNPPLIVWLTEALVALARGLGVSPLIAFRGLLLGLTALSLGLSWRLSRDLPPTLRQVGLITWVYLLLTHAGWMTGQREHLLLILVLPYAYGAIARVRGVHIPVGLGLITGLLAGVGFGLKPFFVPTSLAIELFVALRCGKRALVRPQALALAMVFLVYAVALLVVAPQYLDVARRFAPLYPYHMPGGPMLLTSSWRLGVVILAVILAQVLLRRMVPGWGEIFSLLALGLTASVYLTGKGWRYHWFPAVAFAAALLAGCAALVVSRRRLAWGRPWPAAVFGLAVLALSALSVMDTLFERRRDADAIRLVHQYGHDGAPILILSPWVHQSFPMINEAGATWAMRHPMLWQIAAFYQDAPWLKGQYHALDAMSGPERRFLAEIAEDFERFQPALLLVNDDPPTPAHRGFDYLEYMSQDPQFARTLAHYTYATRTVLFRVYRRRDEVGPAPRLKSRVQSSRLTERSSQSFSSAQSVQVAPGSSGEPSDAAPSGPPARLGQARGVGESRASGLLRTSGLPGGGRDHRG